MPTGPLQDLFQPLGGGWLLIDSKQPWTISPFDRTELERQTLHLYSVLLELTGGNKAPHDRLLLCQQAARSVLRNFYPELADTRIVWVPPFELIHPHSTAWTATTWEAAVEPTLLALPFESSSSAPPSPTSPTSEET
jgi:hypothetical protein